MERGASPVQRPGGHPPDLPDDLVPEPPHVEGEAGSEGSLRADVEALIADGKTYLEAELAYQKSRVSYSADRFKWVAVHGAAAFGLLHLALIALVVGAVIALSPLIGPWLATSLVVALLLLGAFVFVRKLRARLREIGSAFADKSP